MGRDSTGSDGWARQLVSYVLALKWRFSSSWWVDLVSNSNMIIILAIHQNSSSHFFVMIVAIRLKIFNIYECICAYNSSFIVQLHKILTKFFEFHWIFNRGPKGGLNFLSALVCKNFRWVRKWLILIVCIDRVRVIKRQRIWKMKALNELTLHLFLFLACARINQMLSVFKTHESRIIHATVKVRTTNCLLSGTVLETRGYWIEILNCLFHRYVRLLCYFKIFSGNILIFILRLRWRSFGLCSSLLD